MNITNPVIVFSVFNIDKTYGQNKLAHDKTLDLLNSNGIKHKVLDGFYKGSFELSILVVDSIETRILINQIALKHHQECILLLDSNRHAELFNVRTNTTEALGLLQLSIGRPKANNWSYDSVSGAYFYTKDKV